MKIPNVTYFLNICLAQNVGLLNFFSFFLKYFFGSLKVGNYKIGWMCLSVKSENLFSFLPNFWLTECFNGQNNPYELNTKVPDHSGSQSHTYVSENNLTKLDLIADSRKLSIIKGICDFRKS